tara:strand:- start:159 stop:965 length:807 start_codon:yes stop_codon:yes gene_type:complete
MSLALSLDKELLEKLAAAKPSLFERQQQEMQMWQDWKASGEDPDKLRPLMSSFQPLIQGRVNKYARQVPIPPAAIEAEVNTRFLEALRTYDPARTGYQGKTAKLSTHVYRNLKKSGRWIKKYQNVGTIPEKRIDQITNYKTAMTNLTDQLGREPSEHELAQNLQWAPAEVSRMQTEMRKDYLGSQWDMPEAVDPVFQMPSAEREMVHLIKYELTPRENLVLEHSMGLNGKRKLGTNQIAKKLGVSAPTVSRTKGKIASLFEDYGYGNE